MTTPWPGPTRPDLAFLVSLLGPATAALPPSLSPQLPAVLGREALYAWADGHGEVLYVGSSLDARKRLRSQLVWVAKLRGPAAPLPSMWSVAGAGATAVVARAADPRLHFWSGVRGVRAHETAVVRACAVRGATPAAQGAGWDWGAGKSVMDGAATPIVDAWDASGLL